VRKLMLPLRGAAWCLMRDGRGGVRRGRGGKKKIKDGAAVDDPVGVGVGGWV